ncbi:aminoglycoside phosphotransferase family protein [Agrobacterium rosae]|uniref:aminoglycoside phosphotransferase family protein n=1 Tax=Agrobacterium rosae TaxID=1972867 RepID=UPI002A17E890|nr:aminoglycoside phosphotransferase family protein [Agrobacterium rosae]MDX8316377.1 aminoglycoside phosphotransferase family protein [Agrobacterium rosae]
MTENLAQTPIPAELTRRWSISSAFLIADTPTSLVYRVTLADASSAIVKALKPKGMGELPGMAFLEWCDGHGTGRLIDRVDHICLLEDAGDMTLREYRVVHGETSSNAIIVDTLKKLHSDRPRPTPELTPLREHFEALFKRALRETNDEVSPVLRHAASIAEDLLSNQVNVRPLHGDLHHDNIIFSHDRGWLGIDPQGLLGDAAYEVANVFGNPLGAFDDIINPARIATLVSLFADALGCHEEKILRYALAHAGVSICWSLEDGGTALTNDNARERLAFFNVAASLL